MIERNPQAAAQTGGHDNPKERRRERRFRMLKMGHIISTDRRHMMDCKIYDLSSNGACLIPADPMRCPAHFILKIKGGETYHCESRWREAGFVGVMFLRRAEIRMFDSTLF